MNNIFDINRTDDNDEDLPDKIDIDELYEKKHQKDLIKLNLYKKILNRVHNKIKIHSNKLNHLKCIWYQVPEILLGEPLYESASCIAYLIHSLKENGFLVHYYVPNMLFISWEHWFPYYVRTEIKKKTGININEYGQKIEDPSDEETNNEYNQSEESSNKQQKTKQFTPIQNYKPRGYLRK